MNKAALLFPGQGSQFPGMGKALYDYYPETQRYYDIAEEILGFNIQEIMFYGSAEDLKQTKVTQPAIFLHSIISLQVQVKIYYHAVAGHSLGELSALVANGTLCFERALKLVAQRAFAMQHACESTQGTMAAVLFLSDEKIAETCQKIVEEDKEIVVPANYNCPGQVVISGTNQGIELALIKLKEAGAKKIMKLPVGGAFHSPLMQTAFNDLKDLIEKTPFSPAKFPIYQNYTALPSSDPDEIKYNLLNQIISPVLWTQSIQKMVSDGILDYLEVGPGKVLEGLVSKIDKNCNVFSCTNTCESVYKILNF